MKVYNLKIESCQMCPDKTHGYWHCKREGRNLELDGSIPVWCGLPDAQPLPPTKETCPDCGAQAVVRHSGCKQCMSCHWSACG